MTPLKNGCSFQQITKLFFVIHGLKQKKNLTPSSCKFKKQCKIKMSSCLQIEALEEHYVFMRKTMMMMMIRDQHSYIIADSYFLNLRVVLDSETHFDGRKEL